jgi:F1F0 ATPase subunit 2
MSEPAYLALAGIQGVLLGAVFFGGLLWTVRRAVVSKQPAVWFIVSLAVRTVIAIAGFWLVSRGDWRRIAACMLGFVVSRMIVMRLTGAPAVRERGQLRKGEA